MTNSKLDSVWIGDDEIRIDFTNDFHCAIKISKEDSLDDFADRLILMAHTIKDKAYIDAIEEGHRRTNEALAPLVKRMYDETARPVPTKGRIVK